jgi:hypothetical protein
VVAFCEKTKSLKATVKAAFAATGCLITLQEHLMVESRWVMGA